MLLDVLAVIEFASLALSDPGRLTCKNRRYPAGRAAGSSSFLFRGGIFITGIATLFVIAAFTHRRALSGKLLGIPVFGRGWLRRGSRLLRLLFWPEKSVG